MRVPARLAATVAIAASAAGAVASGIDDDDAQKAAFAVNFAKFTDWPSDRFPLANGVFSLCQLQGSDSLSRALRALEGKTVQGYPIAFKKIESPVEAPTCMMLFSGGRPPSLLGRNAVLTVGDRPGFARQGGMIGFVRDGSRLRFEINLGAMQRSGLSMSSQVLTLAAAVFEPQPASPTGEQFMFQQATTESAGPSINILPLQSLQGVLE